MRLTKSYKLKILPTNEQVKFLEDYFSRFAKAVNFYISKIGLLRKDYEWLSKDKQKKGKCANCGQNTDLSHKFLPANSLVCPRCYNYEVGDLFIRKKLYATRIGPNKRKRGRFDVRDATKLPGTDYALAFKRAADTIKGQKKQLGKVKKQLVFTERRLNEWIEVLENKETLLQDGKKALTRFTLPKKPGQKVERFKHILYKDNPSQGKTESQIKGIIKALDRTVQRLTKRLKTADIKFNGDIVDLHYSAVKNIIEKFTEISLDLKKQQFPIAAENVVSKKSRGWIIEKINEMKKGKPLYPLLLKKKNDFYLSYPVRLELEEPKEEKVTKAMGIDRGVNQIAVTAVIDRPTDKPHHIEFYSGKDLIKSKLKYQLIRKKFTGTKSVNKRRAKFGEKVARGSMYVLHDISRQIVNQAKEQKPIVIVMEDLKMIQGEKRVKKGSAVRERKVNFLLSNFNYGRLQSLISYKALQEGIPIRFIKPEYTSQTCSKCREIGKRTKGFFQCVNPKCNHKMNADLNAAINIANSYCKEDSFTKKPKSAILQATTSS